VSGRELTPSSRGLVQGVRNFPRGRRDGRTDGRTDGSRAPPRYFDGIDAEAPHREVIAVGGGEANACCGAKRARNGAFHAVDKVSCFSLRATACEKVDQKSIDRAPRPAVS